MWILLVLWGERRESKQAGDTSYKALESSLLAEDDIREQSEATEVAFRGYQHKEIFTSEGLF